MRNRFMNRNSFFNSSRFMACYRAPEGDGGAGGGGEGNDGGEGGGGGAGDKVDKGDKADHVSRADHERALADLQKFKREAAKLKEEKENEKTNKLKEQNQWKEIAEQREREAKEAREESERIRNSYVGERKFNAVRGKCEALGLRPEAISDLEMLDLEEIQIETTNTGKINVLGADRFAQRLKTLKPHWFADKTPPNVNTKGARINDNGGVLTAADLIAAEREGRKSGDMSKYHELHAKFQQQRKAAMAKR